MPRLKTRKGLWLLALLALRHDRDVDRNWLAGTLWPDAEEATALNYLRQTLTDLRKALGPALYWLRSLTASRSLCLELEDGECDVARFDTLIAQGKPEAYEEAVELYSGALLEGCTEEWVVQASISRAGMAASFGDAGDPRHGRGEPCAGDPPAAASDIRGTDARICLSGADARAGSGWGRRGRHGELSRPAFAAKA